MTTQDLGRFKNDTAWIRDIEDYNPPAELQYTELENDWIQQCEEFDGITVEEELEAIEEDLLKNGCHIITEEIDVDLL